MTTPPTEVELQIRLETKLTHNVRLVADSDDHIIDLNYRIIGEYLLTDAKTGYMESHDCHLGEINLQVIRLDEAIEQGLDIFDLFDQSQSLHDLYTALYDIDADTCQPSLLKRFPHASAHRSDIIYIEEMVIKPWARGQKLGLSVLQTIERTWASGCEFMVLNPYPMQFCSIAIEECPAEYELAQLSDNKQISIKNLEFHFEQLGYKKLDQSPYQLKWLLGSHNISVDSDNKVTIPTHIAQQNSLT